MAAPAVVKGLLVIGTLALVAFGFGGESSKKARPPYLKPIKVPGNELPWSVLDEAICLCFEAGETEGAKLVNCSLARIYPDIGWPARPDDHVTVTRTWQAAGFRVSEFLKLVGKGENPCASVKPEEPTEPTGPATPAHIADLIKDEPNAFVGISKAHNGNPDFASANVYKLAGTSSNVGRATVARANVGYNLYLYSRRRKASDYGAARVIGGKGSAGYYDIGPAWLPENQRMLAAATAHEKLHRWISWAGTNKAPGGDAAYGTPWSPPMTMANGILVQTNKDPWAPENNPPADVLAALGLKLEEMRETWLANNP